MMTLDTFGDEFLFRERYEADVEVLPCPDQSEVTIMITLPNDRLAKPVVLRKF